MYDKWQYAKLVTNIIAPTNSGPLPQGKTPSRCLLFFGLGPRLIRLAFNDAPAAFSRESLPNLSHLFHLLFLLWVLHLYGQPTALSGGLFVFRDRPHKCSPGCGGYKNNSN
jgi:hypothetical protein